MVKRLGLAREAGEPLYQVVEAAGWEPVTVCLTALRPTNKPLALAHPDAVLILSPAGARMAVLPEGVPVLVTGEGTACCLAGRRVMVSAEPCAEGLWALLREHFPLGGDFLVVRGERGRGFLEKVAAGTPWRLVPWVTHSEQALDPLPELPVLDGALALSPLQAELLGPRAGGILRFAWGERTAAAFSRVGFPAHAICDPKPSALRRMLAPYA